MHGYAWVTGGGIYMILNSRWCKVTQFRADSHVAVGWGQWEAVTECAVVSHTQPDPRTVMVAEVRPGDIARIGGRHTWARTTMIHTVLEIDTEPAPDATGRLLCTPTAAWLANGKGVVEFGQDGARTDSPGPSDVTPLQIYRVLNEMNLQDGT